MVEAITALESPMLREITVLLISLAFFLPGAIQVMAQAKPCGLESTPGPRSWVIAPCNVAPEPSDERLAALRRARGAVFDDDTGRKKPEDLAEDNPDVGRGRSVGVPTYFPPLPVAESDTVVLGTVTGFQPYFSNDRTAIYHELTVKIESTLKDNTSRPAAETLAILGEGGSVRLPDGRVFTDFVPPKIQNDIRVGSRYLLFLVYRPKGDYFALLKAWELRGGRAIPMALHDIKKAGAGKLPLAGAPEAVFLDAVRNAILRPE